MGQMGLNILLARKQMAEFESLGWGNYNCMAKNTKFLSDDPKKIHTRGYKITVRSLDLQLVQDFSCTYRNDVNDAWST